MFNNVIGIKNQIILGLLVFVCACQSSHQESSLLPPPIELTVGEGFNNPLGYYEKKPRFSWKLSTDSQANHQSAYQIQVTSSPESYHAQNLLWDSQKNT